MPKWTHVVVHHSLTPDSEKPLPDSVAIRRFHTSYRQYGNIITQEEYHEKKAAGEKGLSPPWKDIGYHWVIERLSDGRPWLLQGRSMMFYGAHCPENGMNRRGIGVCLVGNYDKGVPDEDVFEKAADVVGWLCRMYRIPVENVHAHHDFASYKSCPGTQFDMDYFRERVAEYLDRWTPSNQNGNRRNGSG